MQEVEENVAVGKRKVLSGGVRVTTSVERAAGRGDGHLARRSRSRSSAGRRTAS